ncbi:MAG: hypothetical protein GTO40_16230 [Deltaproteobacteria bacterium]|nr:hypothetical protein [Deltaproteobacteria bacterium]
MSETIFTMSPDLQLEEGSPGLSPDEFIASIWLERRRFVQEGRIKQPHPWSVALAEGKVSREAVVAYVKNRHYFLANINRKDAQIIANCPVSEARRLLMRKYLDEEGQDIVGGKLGPHYEMWVRVAEGLGISREDLNSFKDVLPAYRYTVDAIFSFAKHHSWLEGLAATYATEGQMWRRYTPKEEHRDTKLMGEGEALKKYYGLPNSALEFFNVHSDANDEHGDICEKILKNYCVTRELQRKALSAARFRWDNHETRRDIIYHYFVTGNN